MLYIIVALAILCLVLYLPENVYIVVFITKIDIPFSLRAALMCDCIVSLFPHAPCCTCENTKCTHLNLEHTTDILKNNIVLVCSGQGTLIIYLGENNKIVLMHAHTPCVVGKVARRGTALSVCKQVVRLL